jgi:hypothetical protein
VAYFYFSNSGEQLRQGAILLVLQRKFMEKARNGGPFGVKLVFFDG